MINSIGLPNKGLDGYLAHDLPQLAALPVPLIVNVMGSSAEDVGVLVSAFAERDEVAALELNVSCPNVRDRAADGRRPGGDGRAARRGAAADRQAADREAHAELRVAGRRRRGGRGARRRRRLADQHGARDGHAPAPARASRGSAAGPAASPGRRSARSRWRRSREVRERVRIPIVGMGGVQSGRHARDLLDAGADLVGVGTESFRDPRAGARIAAELGQFPANSGIIGCAPDPPPRL